MMWIFGQVWFACLVGFVAGVLLDWMLRVRPLSRRVAELESHELGGGEDTGSYRTQHTPPRQVLSPYGSDADRPGRSASTIGGSTSLSDLLDPPRAGAGADVDQQRVPAAAGEVGDEFVLGHRFVDRR